MNSISTFQELKTKQNELFEQWRRFTKHSHFVSDGLVDPEEYFSEPVKIVYLAKQARDEQQEYDWDLCSGLAIGGKSNNHVWKNWGRVARWICDIIEGPKEWKEIEYLDLPSRAKWLRKIGVVNLMKIASPNVTTYKVLKEYTKIHGRFAFQQLELYRPDYIICGGTADLVHKYVFMDNERGEWQRSKTYWRWFQMHNPWSCKVIDYYHHAARMKKNEMNIKQFHLNLVNVFREISKEDKVLIKAPY